MVDKIISVIIPAYNCNKYILKLLNSILNQSYSNIELLIDDDASTDNTRKIIDSLKNLRIKTKIVNMDKYLYFNKKQWTTSLNVYFYIIDIKIFTNYRF